MCAEVIDSYIKKNKLDDKEQSNMAVEIPTYIPEHYARNLSYSAPVESENKDGWFKSKLKKAFRTEKKTDYGVCGASMCASSIFNHTGIVTGGPGGQGFVYPTIKLNATGSLTSTTIYRPGEDDEIQKPPVQITQPWRK